MKISVSGQESVGMHMAAIIISSSSSSCNNNSSIREAGRLKKYKRWAEFSGFMNPYHPVSCWVKGQKCWDGCGVNQQVCFCHTVWILFALHRPQSEGTRSLQKQIRETAPSLLAFLLITSYLFLCLRVWFPSASEPLMSVCFALSDLVLLRCQLQTLRATVTNSSWSVTKWPWSGPEALSNNKKKSQKSQFMLTSCPLWTMFLLDYIHTAAKSVPNLTFLAICDSLNSTN